MQGKYTIDDYLALPDDVRYELIDGELIKMESPTRTHQSIAGYLFHRIYSFIEENGGSCTPYIAPLDVQLDKDNKTIVQPDVMIVCDHDVETDKDIVITYLFGEEENNLSFSVYTMREDIPVGIYDGKCSINFSKLMLH